MHLRSLKYMLLPLLVMLLPAHLLAQGYRIEVTLKGLSSDTLILGEYFTTRMVPKDTVVTDAKGHAVFRGDKAFAGGLYLLYFNPDCYFDFLLGEDQELAVSADTGDLAGTIRFEGSADNQAFLDYKAFLQDKRTEVKQETDRLAQAKTAQDSARIQDRQKAINQEMESYMDALERDHGEGFVGTFVGATREPFPPESLLTGDKRFNDSLRYFYYRDHYFDRFDPFDVRLLHTPLYEGKIKGYLNRVVVQHPDSLIVAVDFLLQGAKKSDELYRYMLITLFNHFAESKFMGMDVVYFHIAEYYYIPDATWSSRDFIDKLRENLQANQHSLIGQIAPNIALRELPSEHFLMAQEDTAIKRDPHIGQDFLLHDIQAPYTILYFWEADCGHCQKSTPALYQVYERLKDKGVKVVCTHVINTVEGKELWVDFVNEHGLYDWINCWSPYSNEFRKLYNLQSYPQLFILDENKEIVAKRITPEQAEQIIDNLLKTDS
ncbi:MAG: thioredoxin-like domain-containing protein [Bacteroidales bacterium]